jgi:hypothetical protein
MSVAASIATTSIWDYGAGTYTASYCRMNPIATFINTPNDLTLTLNYLANSDSITSIELIKTGAGTHTVTYSHSETGTDGTYSAFVDFATLQADVAGLSERLYLKLKITFPLQGGTLSVFGVRISGTLASLVDSDYALAWDWTSPANMKAFLVALCASASPQHNSRPVFVFNWGRGEECAPNVNNPIMFAHFATQRGMRKRPELVVRENTLRIGIRRVCHPNQLFEDQFFVMLAAIKDRLGPLAGNYTYDLTVNQVVHYGVTAFDLGFSMLETYGDNEIKPEGEKQCGCTWWETTLYYNTKMRETADYLLKA